MAIKVSVIIPFYQRETGILRRAIDSISNQILPPGIEVQVIIVDDGSPLPARDELEGADIERLRITLIEKPNGGPGAARNAALDRLPVGTVDFVAFLDSDDVWQPQHLSRALTALRKSDVFFCNHVRKPYYDDYFSTLPEMGAYASEAAAAHEGIVLFDAGELTATMVRECPPQTSTVVYNFPRNRDLRFNEALRSAGEDHVFWIELSLANTTAIDPRVNVMCLEGVNLYWSNVSWSSPKSISIQGCLAIQYNYMKETPQLLNADPATVLFRHRLYEGAYAYAILRGVLKRFRPEFRILSRLVWLYPGCVLRLPANLLFFMRHRGVMTDETSVKGTSIEDAALSPT